MSNQIITSQQVTQLLAELDKWVQVTDVLVEFDRVVVRHEYDYPFVRDFLQYSHWGDLVSCCTLTSLVNSADFV